MNKHVKKFVNDRNEKINAIIGDEITVNEFIHLLNENLFNHYSIYNGWNINDLNVLSEKSENCCNRGTITDIVLDEGCLSIELNNEKRLSENFTLGVIKKITVNDDNNFYVIYNDNSYFRIVIQ